MSPPEGVEELQDAYAAYQQNVSAAYDEVVDDVITLVAASGSVGKSDIAALTSWKRLRGDTTWMRELMLTPDREVRRVTADTVSAATAESVSVPEAARAARGTLTPLPGFNRGDALASTVCFVAAPGRLAVYDRRAHAALRKLGLDLDNRPGRYGRYMGRIERCRAELVDHGHEWTARQVDLALFTLGGGSGRTAA